MQLKGVNKVRKEKNYMKQVITYILKEGDGKNFRLNLALSSTQNPNTVISRLLALKNRTLLAGEEPITLVRISTVNNLKSYEHDWKREDGVYKCKDCGVHGVRATPMSKIHPVRTNERFKDCSWKIKK